MWRRQRKLIKKKKKKTPPESICTLGEQEVTSVPYSQLTGTSLYERGATDTEGGRWSEHKLSAEYFFAWKLQFTYDISIPDFFSKQLIVQPTKTKNSPTLASLHDEQVTSSERQTTA